MAIKHSINDDRYSWILRQSRQYECLLPKSIDFGVRQKKLLIYIHLQ